jgi:hypothetical protein
VDSLLDIGIAGDLAPVMAKGHVVSMTPHGQIISRADFGRAC